MTYTGSNGKTYITEAQPLGKGGEGEVYRIQGDPDLVLKLYLPRYRTEERHRKLFAMIQTPLSPDALKQTTWPVDIVYDNGSFAGYVMPFLSGVKQLNVIYALTHGYSLSKMIMIAKNLCAAVHSIHQAGQVIGDFNPNNICVDPNTGLVTLIDTDSYHITDNNGGRTYRCEVGLPEYLAKEIQDKLRDNKQKNLDLRTLPLPTFTKETDLFALAVHVFALLMNGSHPFASAVDPNPIVIASRTSVVNPQPIENIRNAFFPFYVNKPGYTTPKYAPEFAALPPVIQQLFVKAFVDGSTNPKMRPSAQEWYEALSEFENHLKKCSKNSSHEYYDQLSTCPWCELEKKANRPTPIIRKTSATTNEQKNTSPPKSGRGRGSGPSCGTICILLVILILLIYSSVKLINHIRPEENSINGAANTTTTIAQSTIAESQKEEGPEWPEGDFRPRSHGYFGSVLAKNYAGDHVDLCGLDADGYVDKKNVIAKIPNETEIVIIDSGGIDWAKTIYNGKEGYVYTMDLFDEDDNYYKGIPYSRDFVFHKDGVEVVKHDDGNWVVKENGKIMTDSLGFASNSYGIWFFERGYVNFDYTGPLQLGMKYGYIYPEDLYTFMINNGQLVKVISPSGETVWVA